MQCESVAAAIDVGSNSIKMTIARLSADGEIEQIDWASETVRLGEGVAESRRLADDRTAAAIETLRRFAARARELGAREIVAAATEATRTATNGPEFLQRVRQETGIDVRAIDGEEEAALTFAGLASAMDLTGTVLVADIGGGSTELIAAVDGAMVASQSIPLGSGRLTERVIRTDPPTIEELDRAEAEAASAMRQVLKHLSVPNANGGRLIVVGGTGEFLTRLVPADRTIDLPAIRHVLVKLASLTVAEVADAIEAPEARARVLPAGVAIVAAIATSIDAQAIEVARSGLRTGLLIRAFSTVRQDAEPVCDSPPPPPNARPRTETSDVRGKQEAPAVISFSDAMKSLIGERWQMVWKTIPAALDDSDIEGVHDVRVASRRLRAAMDVAAPLFPQRWYKALHRTAKEITSALGDVRDRDVLLVSLRAERETASIAEQPGIDRLIERVDRERRVARVDMEGYLSDLLLGPVGPEVERRFGVPLVLPKGATRGREG